MNIIESLLRLRTMLSCVFLAAALVSPIRAESGETRSAGAPKAADEGYDAAFVSQSVPSFIELFKPVAVSVTMRNTGTATWFRSEGDVFLATQEPQDNFYWCIQDNPHGIYSGNRVLLPHDVPPGAEVTFSFVVKPLSCRFAATAPFRFRVLSQMHGTFGEESPDPGIVISTASEFASQQVPDIAPAGAKVRVTVSFKNTTLTTWQPADGYALGFAGPTANDTWGPSSIPLAEPVAPGALATFTFVVDVPDVVATYNFQWQMNSDGNVPFGQVSPATPVKVVAAGPANYQGLWWASPAGTESGWGINVAHQGSIIFATWFTYDANGDALWLSVTANQDTTGRFTGTLVQTTGPAFDAALFQPSLVRGVAVGTAAFTFDDIGGGTFAYTLNGISQTKAIVRQEFGPLPTCTFALVSDLTRAYNYQDIWWAAPAGSEDGWGINLTHQGDIIFATWFTYDRDNSPMWLSFTAPKTATDTAAVTYSGTLYRTSGPAFDSVPFDPKQVAVTAKLEPRVSRFPMAMQACSHGRSTEFREAKSITRQIFQTPGTICQ